MNNTENAPPAQSVRAQLLTEAQVLLLHCPTARFDLLTGIEPLWFSDPADRELFQAQRGFWQLAPEYLRSEIDAHLERQHDASDDGAEAATLFRARELLAFEYGTEPREQKPVPRAKALLRELKHAVETEGRAFGFATDESLDAVLGAQEWLWPGYIPRGLVTGLVAPQDEGKSTVAQDFCRTVLSGGRWPDGQQCDAHSGKLLWIDTDGNLALFHQRLKAWKMPRGRFIFPPDVLQELSIDDPQSLKWIEQAIEKFHFPLIVVDALSGSHSGKENDADSMKGIMKRLHTLAQKHKTAVLVIHHLNKAPTGTPTYPLTIDRLRGSSSISQLCRSILALTTPDPTQPNARRLDVIKLNPAKKPPPVGYVLTDDGPAWGSAPEPPKERQTADDGADFLRTALANGKRAAGEVFEEAKALGISDFALRGARKSLGVKVEKSKAVKNAPWTWELPENDGGE